MATTPATSTPADASKLRLVHGPVSAVRAVPSREVSVISIEIPDEHHVQATSLVYGRYALILRSSLEKGTRYGVLDVDLGAAVAGGAPRDPLAFAHGHEDESHAPPTVLHARVALVRPVPSRMVTVVYLEVPDAQHVEVTNLLHGRDAIAFPVNLPPQSPLGILRLGQGAGTSPVPSAGSPAPPARRMSAVATRSSIASNGLDATPRPASRILGRHMPPTLVVTRWLGVQCATEQFQEFLGVRTEAAARDRVCMICGVQSRGDIRESAEATEAFLTKIYSRFDEYRKQAAQAPVQADLERSRHEFPPR